MKKHIFCLQSALVLALPYHSQCFSISPFTRQLGKTAYAKYIFQASAEDNVDELKKEADRIRQEIAEFEQEKEQVVINEEKKRQKIKEEKEEVRSRYAVEVPILKGDGQTVMERVDFPPRLSGGKFP